MNTPASAKFVIEPLGRAHDRAAFNCGVSDLDTYLQQQAAQDMKRDVAVPYVLTLVDAPSQIAGFYTLSATSVKLGEFPDEVLKRLPRYPAVPATLLGRLAISINHRRQGLGERLLVDALHRSLAASKSVGSVAIIVDAKDEASAAFYVKYGFVRFVDSPLRLFITMKTVAALWPSRADEGAERPE